MFNIDLLMYINMSHIQVEKIHTLSSSIPISSGVKHFGVFDKKLTWGSLIKYKSDYFQ